MNSARCILSENDCKIFQTITDEWHNSINIEECFLTWESKSKCKAQSKTSFLHTLCFHIRGLGLRWGEVLLLTLNGKFDVITLLETGKFCKSTITNAFPDYNIFYQKGGNPHGGVLILIKQYIRVSRIQRDV
ncbi:unnamed protein product [Didymodactylos carnosus]|uniref:Uncharacterized protein n=1 Tax=Didymodactylos carnosus TaxID=1234261 RepID=A0A815VZ21_9BILA|nr:unnamed protein product [Didymodactylos carnosus]CAF4396419.1 unnamed protein product [Didymodactylos carnosus]